MAGNELRVRRPQEHEVLIQSLRDEGGFPTIRDALLFAAGLGIHSQRRKSFEAANEPIRYETVVDPPYAGAFINMIAAVECQDDAEILDLERLDERIVIFEEYANGGLGFLQEELNVRGQPMDVVLNALVTEALTAGSGAEPVSIDDLLKGF